MADGNLNATPKPEGLALMRAPFEERQISKKPVPTKRQTEEVKSGKVKAIKCRICGGYHHPNAIHLDYVGHAALTDRLLECDPEWSWEPFSMSQSGLPLMDDNGGLWIRLTVCGVTRIGYGDADGKRGGAATKEAIGDALRNAAMRFGAALDLWHKGDLHGDDDDEEKEGQRPAAKPEAKKQPESQNRPPAAKEPENKDDEPESMADTIIRKLGECSSTDELDSFVKKSTKTILNAPDRERARIQNAISKRRAELVPVDTRPAGQKFVDEFSKRIADKPTPEECDAYFDKHEARLDHIRDTEPDQYDRAVEAHQSRMAELADGKVFA